MEVDYYAFNGNMNNIRVAFTGHPSQDSAALLILKQLVGKRFELRETAHNSFEFQILAK